MKFIKVPLQLNAKNQPKQWMLHPIFSTTLWKTFIQRWKDQVRLIQDMVITFSLNRKRISTVIRVPDLKLITIQYLFANQRFLSFQIEISIPCTNSKPLKCCVHTKRIRKRCQLLHVRNQTKNAYPVRKDLWSISWIFMIGRVWMTWSQVQGVRLSYRMKKD